MAGKHVLGIDIGGTKVAAGLVNSAGEIVSVAREDLFARHALPFAPIVLGQSRIDDRTETEKRRRLLRARKRAHEGARRLETCGRQEMRELRSTFGAQGFIAPALDAALRIPRGRTVADERNPHRAGFPLFRRLGRMRAPLMQT